MVERHRPVVAGPRLDIAEAEREIGAEATSARRRPPDQAAVAVDRLVVQQQRMSAVDSEQQQAAREAGVAPRAKLLAAEETARLVPCDGETEAGLERRVVGTDVVAPVAEPLLDAAGVETIMAGVGEAVRRAGPDQRGVDTLGVFDRHRELPAEFTDETDTRDPDRCGSDLEILRGREREGGVRQIGARERFEQRPRRGIESAN